MSDKLPATEWKAEKSPVAGWIVTDGNGKNWADHSGFTAAFISQDRAEGFAAAMTHASSDIARLRSEADALRVRADRYDWIRRNAVLDGTNGDEFDSEIDAAISMGADA